MSKFNPWKIVVLQGAAQFVESFKDFIPTSNKKEDFIKNATDIYAAQVGGKTNKFTTPEKFKDYLNDCIFLSAVLDHIEKVEAQTMPAGFLLKVEGKRYQIDRIEIEYLSGGFLKRYYLTCLTL